MVVSAIILCVHTRGAAEIIPTDSIQYYINYGQVEKARKLIETVLVNKNDNQNIAHVYILLAELEESEGYTEKATNAFRSGLRIARENGLDKIIARASHGLAATMITTAKYDSARIMLALSLKSDISNENKIAVNLVSGRLSQSLNEHDKALTKYQEAYTLAEKVNDTKSMALAIAGMGSIYFSLEPDMKHALNHFHRSVLICDSVRHFNIIARNYGRIANANMVLGNGKEAEKYLLRAKKITDISGNLPVHGYILASLSILKAGDGDINSAIDYVVESASIKRKLGLLRSLQNDLLNLGDLYLYVKKYNEADVVWQEGIQTSRMLKDVVYMEYFYEKFAQLDSLRGNYAGAYSNLKKAMLYKDSVIEKQRVNAVEELREKYEAEQKEKTIAEKELKIQQQRFQLSLIISGSIIAILSLTGLLIHIRNRHRINLQKEKETEHQRRLQTIVSTQEEVQQSIARDLHDGLVQVLGAAKVSLEAIQGQGDRQVILEKVKTASQIMDEACVEARTISHQILPYSLLRDGLLAALEELFRKSLPSYHLDVQGTPFKLSGDVAINLYRIAQELVNNIIKHSEATFVQSTFAFFEKEIIFTVTDNGKGFSSNEVVSGVGIMNMKTRAEVIGGRFSIDSKPGVETTVTVKVPV